MQSLLNRFSYSRQESNQNDLNVSKLVIENFNDVLTEQGEYIFSENLLDDNEWLKALDELKIIRDSSSAFNRRVSRRKVIQNFMLRRKMIKRQKIIRPSTFKAPILIIDSDEEASRLVEFSLLPFCSEIIGFDMEFESDWLTFQFCYRCLIIVFIFKKREKLFGDNNNLWTGSNSLSDFQRSRLQSTHRMSVITMILRDNQIAGFGISQDLITIKSFFNDEDFKLISSKMIDVGSRFVDQNDIMMGLDESTTDGETTGKYINDTDDIVCVRDATFYGMERLSRRCTDPKIQDVARMWLNKFSYKNAVMERAIDETYVKYAAKDALLTYHCAMKLFDISFIYECTNIGQVYYCLEDLFFDYNDVNEGNFMLSHLLTNGFKRLNVYDLNGATYDKIVFKREKTGKEVRLERLVKQLNNIIDSNMTPSEAAVSRCRLTDEVLNMSEEIEHDRENISEIDPYDKRVMIMREMVGKENSSKVIDRDLFNEIMSIVQKSENKAKRIKPNSSVSSE